MKNLIFERPVFIFDLETTGLDPLKDRICQLAFQRWDPRSTEGPIRRSWLINPTIPIPASATAVHSITDEQVADKPTFDRFANSLYNVIAGCDLVGYNIARFDIQLLWEEFNRAGIDWDYRAHRVIDALALWRKMMPRKLFNAAQEFCPELGITEDQLHEAGMDVSTCFHVVSAQLQRWGQDMGTAAQLIIDPIEINGIEAEPVDLAGVIASVDGVEYFTHRKVRGVAVLDDRKYAHWILKGDFSDDTKRHLRRILGITEPAARAS